MATETVQYSLRDHDLVFAESPVAADYVLRVRDMPDDDRPRERLQELGATELSVAELLAIIWGVGSKSEDVLAMARRTLKEYGEKTIASELNPERLADAADIPLTKACQVVAAFELGRRYFAVQNGQPVFIRNAPQAYEYFRPMGTSQKEQLRGLYLNSRYQVIHDEVISVGSLTSNIVHPREVLRPALERGAVAVILAHNHPSGRLEPTEADLAITQQLIAAAKVLGIELLDHLVITSSSYASIVDALA